MARLYIDKREVAQLRPDWTSLQQVVSFVESEHLTADSVIRDIQIDGAPLMTESEGFQPPRSMERNQTIEIFTSSLKEVAMNSIREVVVFLERLENALPALASNFRSQFGKHDFDNLRELYEGFYWMNLLLDHLERSFDIDMGCVWADGLRVCDQHQIFASFFKEVSGAHEKRDFDMVAELLECRLMPSLPVWKRIFTTIQEKVANQR
jgi:hypothetical protein